jgi:hypothetical protein
LATNHAGASTTATPYYFCRDDKQGCGKTTYDPPLVEGECCGPAFGYSGREY